MLLATDMPADAKVFCVLFVCIFTFCAIRSGFYYMAVWKHGWPQQPPCPSGDADDPDRE